MSRLVLRSVRLYEPAADQGLSAPVDILIDGQRIGAIEPAGALGTHADDHIIDGHGRLVALPGLINAHFHSPANHLKGAFRSRPLETFMLYESPADPALAPTAREAYLRTMLGALEMVRTGTTSVQDDAFFMPAPSSEIIDAVMQAYADAGIRATVALDQPELADIDKLPFTTGLDDPALSELPAMAASELLEQYDYLFETWHGHSNGRLRAAVSISAPQRVSPDYFAALAELSQRHDTVLFAHMLETRTQRCIATEQPRFAGRSLVEYTADLGLLNERTNVIHAVWVSDHDLDLIAASGASIAHNPVSNLRLGSGVMPLRAALDRGIPVGLGVDEAICDDSVNLWGVVKLAGLIHNISGLPAEQWPQASEVLSCLHEGGAAAMGMSDDLGQIATGRLADVVLLDLDSPAFTPFNDLAGQLVYCEQGNSVRHTIVDGQLVFSEGTNQCVDEPALLAEARELFAQRRPALVAAAQQAQRHEASYASIVEQARTSDLDMNRWVGR
jgi:5-methylthioadenosine/S-adenosylhomocysteine deaminase